MIRNERDMPADLVKIIGTQPIDFAVKARRMMPAKKSMGILLFGVVWTLLMCLVAAAFLGFFGENGITNNDGLKGGDLFITCILGLFMLVGIGLIIGGIYSYTREGGYFVATPNRLIRYYRGNIKATDWEQFNGNIEMNTFRGDLSFELRTGKEHSRKNGPPRFVPDIIHISGVDEVIEIERLCSLRIREHDPLPPSV